MLLSQTKRQSNTFDRVEDLESPSAVSGLSEKKDSKSLRKSLLAEQKQIEQDKKQLQEDKRAL